MAVYGRGSFAREVEDVVAVSSAVDQLHAGGRGRIVGGDERGETSDVALVLLVVLENRLLNNNWLSVVCHCMLYS